MILEKKVNVCAVQAQQDVSLVWSGGKFHLKAGEWLATILGSPVTLDAATVYEENCLLETSEAMAQEEQRLKDALRTGCL